ncbi:MAG: AraC family transcriptional regulator [Pseudomonadota bacterium]
MAIAGIYSEEKKSFIDSIATEALNLSLRTAVSSADRVRYCFDDLLVVLTRQGEIRFSSDLNDEQTLHRTGQILVVPKGVPVYTDYLAPSQRQPLQCITLELSAEVARDRDLENRYRWPEEAPYEHLYSLDDIDEFMQVDAAAAIRRIDYLTRGRYSAAHRNALIDLSSRELMLYIHQSSARRALRRGIRIPAGTRLSEVREYIDSNLANDLSTPALAKQCHLSRAQFHQRFVQLFGETPQSYVQARRLHTARLLLTEDPVSSVAAVAQQTGFRSPAHFSTLFKQYTGLSPSAFRRRRVTA